MTVAELHRQCRDAGDVWRAGNGEMGRPGAGEKR